MDPELAARTHASAGSCSRSSCCSSPAASGSRSCTSTSTSGRHLARAAGRRRRAARPVAVKDLLDTAGLTTTYGSALFVDHVPAESAEAVRRLEAAGYAVAGKTNLHEFAYGISSQNPHFGTVPNPAFPDGSRGGSSGGSAAAGRGGRCRARARHRLRRLHPDPGRVVRRRRLQADLSRLVPVEGCFPLAPSSTTSGRWRPVDGLRAELMARARPRLPEHTAVTSVGELDVGVAWLEEAEPARARGRRRGGGALPARRAVALPFAPSNRADFMREAADVHRALFPGNEELYGENVRARSSAASR